MLVSVVIPCFNAQRWIKETLESVIAQNLSDIEVIVVDDGSTDMTADVVREVMPTAHLICTPNRGCSAARNLGTREAKGEFIQYLDADDLLMPGKLQLQLQTLQKENVDVTYGDWQRLVPNLNGEFVAREIVNRELINPEIDLFTTFWCPPAAYLFRRSIVEKVVWNENLPVIQDARFVLDCALYGARFAKCEGLMAQYRAHTANSVSTRNPIAFVRDCFVNAQEVERWWEQHGGLTIERKEALINCYENVAKGSYKKDSKTFSETVAVLNNLTPSYMPQQPKYLRVLSHTIGYPRAEAFRYTWTTFRHHKFWALLRQGKRILQGAK